MAVASPYAVFRAADLSWPAAAPARRPPAAGTDGTKRSRPGAAHLVTLIQGELFPNPPLA